MSSASSSSSSNVMSQIFASIRNYCGRLLWHQKETKSVSRMDAYLAAMHKVLTWEEPVLSGITLAVLHVLFWLIVQLELRLYGIIFLLLLVALLCDASFEKMGIEAPRSPTSDAMRSSWNLFASAILYLKALRRDSPALFCTYMCAMCVSLSLVARTFSGYTIAYISTLLVFLVPGLIKHLPPELRAKIKNTVETFRTNEGVPEENELMPIITETMEEVSYLDAEGSPDHDTEVDPNDLPDPKQLEISTSDSDSEHKRELNFSTTHFNGSSSSSTSSRSSHSSVDGSPPRKPDSDSEFEIIDDNLEFPADTT